MGRHGLLVRALRLHGSVLILRRSGIPERRLLVALGRRVTWLGLLVSVGLLHRACWSLIGLVGLRRHLRLGVCLRLCI